MSFCTFSFFCKGILTIVQENQHCCLPAHTLLPPLKETQDIYYWMMRIREHRALQLWCRKKLKKGICSATVLVIVTHWTVMAVLMRLRSSAFTHNQSGPSVNSVCTFAHIVKHCLWPRFMFKLSKNWRGDKRSSNN